MPRDTVEGDTIRRRRFCLSIVVAVSWGLLGLGATGFDLKGPSLTAGLVVGGRATSRRIGCEGFVVGDVL